MNLIHRRLCRSAHWKAALETSILPWVLDGVDLGSHILEVGPGPGLTTDLLRTRVPRLTCVEIDVKSAAALSRRLAGTNVSVIQEDASAMSFPDATFDGAVSFTMLHHVATMSAQDRLLAEVARVLRRGATFAGIDSRYSRMFGLLHLFDTMTVVDPQTFPSRLESAGFVDVCVDLNPHAFRFRARRA